MDSENQQPKRMASGRSACRCNEPAEAPSANADAVYWHAVLQVVQAIQGTSLDPSQLLFHDAPGRDPTVIPGRAVIWPLELKAVLGVCVCEPRPENRP